MIRVTCPNGHKINAPPSYAGRTAPCPKCQAMVVIPAGPLVTAEEIVSVLQESEDGKDRQTEELLAGDSEFQVVREFDLNPAAYQPARRSVKRENHDPSGGTRTKVLTLLAALALGLTLIAVSVFVVLRLLPAEIANPRVEDQEIAENSIVEPVKDQAASPANPSSSAKRLGSGGRLASDSTASPSQGPANPLEPDSATGPTSGLKTIFGYDQSRRNQLSEYLQLKGHPRGKIGVLNFRILGKLNGLARELNLEPDAHNQIAFPEKAFPEYRRMFDEGSLFSVPEFAEALPSLLDDLRKDYEQGKLNDSDRHLAFIVFSPFILELL